MLLLSLRCPSRLRAADTAAGGGAVVPTGFTYEMPQPGLTSAGVFDCQGRLIEVLWTRQPVPAGPQVAYWDGRNQIHERVPPGEYEFRVVVNRSTYQNVGAIGNSGRAPTPEAHTPAGMASVAVDAAGAVYTANGWDEAGADFKKWDADGNAVYDARYQMRNGQPNGAPYSIAVDDTTIYCGMEGWASKPWNHKQQVQRFALSDGKLQSFSKVPDKYGHIELYEWPERIIPPGPSEADAQLMRLPLRAIAVAGDSLLVADALAGKVRRFQKVTGEPQGEFAVKLPQALAVDAKGRIWVGHEHSRVSVFAADGKLIAEPLQDLGEIVALACDPAGLLYVADSAADQIKIYDTTGNKARLVRTFGQKAAAGDQAADHFFQLRGVAVDPKGFMATIQTEPAGGARLARWSPDGKLVWEHFGCEFVSLGNYGAHDPSTLYSMTLHRYRLADHDKAQWNYTGCMLAEKPKYTSDVHGVPRLLKLSGHEFWFMPTGDGVQVYRISNSGMRLVSILGGGSPDAEGNRQGKPAQWTWAATTDDAKPTPADIHWFAEPGKAQTCRVWR